MQLTLFKKVAIDPNSKNIPFEDDLLSLKLTILVPQDRNTKKITDVFAVVIKAINYKEHDPPVIAHVRNFIKQKNNSNSVNYTVIEFHVISKYRVFEWREENNVDYEVGLIFYFGIIYWIDKKVMTHLLIILGTKAVKVFEALFIMIE